MFSKRPGTPGRGSSRCAAPFRGKCPSSSGGDRCGTALEVIHQESQESLGSEASRRLDPALWIGGFRPVAHALSASRADPGAAPEIRRHRTVAPGSAEYVEACLATRASNFMRPRFRAPVSFMKPPWVHAGRQARPGPAIRSRGHREIREAGPRPERERGQVLPQDVRFPEVS
jgi:hypothetical protein